VIRWELLSEAVMKPFSVATEVERPRSSGGQDPQ
jgi:hypothetical protein